MSRIGLIPMGPMAPTASGTGFVLSPVTEFMASELLCRWSGPSMCPIAWTMVGSVALPVVCPSGWVYRVMVAISM